MKAMRVLAVIALIVSLSALYPSGASGQPLDHFKCYSVKEGRPANVIVDLIDQFDPATAPPPPVLVGPPIFFCNPAEKLVLTASGGPGAVTPITNPDGHLKMYLITHAAEQPQRTVTVSNQFNPAGAAQLLTVFRPVLLAVPTQKDGHEFPKALDHFKCYITRGRPVQRAVILDDQWDRDKRPEHVVVFEPVLFCNPVTKIHDGVTTTPIPRRALVLDHLTCYRFIPPSTTVRNVRVLNQFGREKIVAAEARYLCVPSSKLSFQ